MRDFAFRYKKVLQGVYTPAGTTGDFTSTYAFPSGPTSEFKRRLIEATLTQTGGNRTRAARALGFQWTYLLRLMREFEVRIPPPPGSCRRANGANGSNGSGPLAPTQRY